jgi:hypothetical protein
MTAEDRLATLGDEVAGFPLDSLDQLVLSVTDAILLRTPDPLESDTHRNLERELAAELGENYLEEEVDE